MNADGRSPIHTNGYVNGFAHQNGHPSKPQPTHSQTQTSPYINANGSVKMLANPDQQSDAIVIICDYIKYRLSLVPWDWEACPELPEFSNDDPRITVRVLCQRFESRYAAELQDLVQTMHLSRKTLYTTFLEIVRGLFSDGVRWGRIVSLYTFGGLLAVRCIHEQMPDMVKNVADWVAMYTETHLYRWMELQGGWNGLVAFYRHQGETEILEDNCDNWVRFKKVMSGVGVACGVAGAAALGAMLISKR